MVSNQLVGIILVVLGLVLLYFGWQSSESVAEQVTESLTGRFTDSTMWYIVGGGVALVAGAFMVFARR